MVVRLTQYDGAKAGKSFFVGRLAKELQRMGVSVTVNGRHDIAMEVIRIKNKSKIVELQMADKQNKVSGMESDFLEQLSRELNAGQTGIQ